MEKRIQEELFDVEVQYCDPDDCLHDCEVSEAGVTHILCHIGKT